MGSLSDEHGDWRSLVELRRRRIGLLTTGRKYWFEKKALDRTPLWKMRKFKSLDCKEGSNCVDFSNSGNLISVAGEDLNIYISDWKTNKPVATIPTESKHSILRSKFHNSDANLISTSYDGAVKIFDIETQNLSMEVKPSYYDSTPLLDFAFLGPQKLVTCDFMGDVCRIDLRVGGSERLWNVHRNSLYTISTNPADEHMIVVGGELPHTLVFDTRLDYPVNHVGSDEQLITTTAFNSAGNKLLISGSKDILVYQTNTCELDHSCAGIEPSIEDACWFFDDKIILGLSCFGLISGWDLKSEQPLFSINDGGKDTAASSICAHPYYNFLASTGPKDIQIWG